MENKNNDTEFDMFKVLLDNVKLNNLNGRTVLYTYGDQELSKDLNGKYYLSNTVYPEYEREISKISALELEKEFKLKQVINNKNRFFED